MSKSSTTSRRAILAGAVTMPIAAVIVPIITVADAKARVQHHVDELHNALRDLYPDLTFFVNAKLSGGLTSDGPVVMMVAEENGHEDHNERV